MWWHLSKELKEARARWMGSDSTCTQASEGHKSGSGPSQIFLERRRAASMTLSLMDEETGFQRKDLT